MLKAKLPDRIILYGHLVSDTPGLVNHKYRYPTLPEFAALVDWWRGLGYSFVNLENYSHDDDRKKILLTFDDGFKVLAGPLADYLGRENIPSMIFMLTAPFEDQQFGKQLLGKEVNQTSDELFLSTNEVLMLKARGTHIGFHTRNHIRLNDDSNPEDMHIIEQLTIPSVYRHLLSEPLCFAYPYQAPETYQPMDSALKKLGYQFIFDTKGFGPAQGAHHFRVSIDAPSGVKKRNWLHTIVMRQMLRYYLKSGRQ